MTEKLLPCPKCASVNVDFDDFYYDGCDVTEIGVGCSDCLIEIRLRLTDNEIEENVKKKLAEMWNTRATPAPVSGEVEEAREAFARTKAAFRGFCRCEPNELNTICTHCYDFRAIGRVIHAATPTQAAPMSSEVREAVTWASKLMARTLGGDIHRHCRTLITAAKTAAPKSGERGAEKQGVAQEIGVGFTREELLKKIANSTYVFENDANKIINVLIDMGAVQVKP